MTDTHPAIVHLQLPRSAIWAQLGPGDVHACHRHGLMAMTTDGIWHVSADIALPAVEFESMRIAPVEPDQRHAITSTVLQSFPVGRWLAHARSEVSMWFEMLAHIAQQRASVDEATREALRHYNTRVEHGAPRPSRRAGTATVYRDLAETYLRIQAEEGTRGINRRVAEELAGDDGPIPEGTFRDWLRRATELGYLSPGQRGRAGRMPGPALTTNPDPTKD